MPSDPAAALTSLLRQASIVDNEEALKIANAALKANKNDLTSQHTRVVALLKLDRFDDALRALDDAGTKLTEICALEKAYALYKTGQLVEADTVLASNGTEQLGFAHVAAQVAYRAERFDEARSTYLRILEDGAGVEENDVRINIKAAEAQATWQGSSIWPQDPHQRHDSFDMSFNAACVLIACGALQAASELLQRASKLCDASEDLNEEDKQSEMRPILAQQAYVYARLGKLKEAQDLYQSLQATQ
jgi:signal recognition particle subunit SRP72